MTFLFIVLCVMGAGAVWYNYELERSGPLTERRAFVVKRGEGARDIGTRLAAQNIIHSPHLFIANYVLSSFAPLGGGKPLTLQAGNYEFEPGQSIREVSNILAKGKTVLFPVTIPEGLTSHQIVSRLMAKPNLTGEIKEVPPEGSLLPDTYLVPRNMHRQKIIDLMTAASQKTLATAWAQRQPELPLKTPRDALILASIVEKETGRREERPMVAGVFINRLRKGMRLQSDPTILYGIDGGKVAWGRPIYRSEIRKKTLHNTYQIDGLPPTPICNPGRAAIEAVLNPAQTEHIYFVADGRGGHIFSKTLDQHNAAVANWRQIEAAIKKKRAREAKQQAIATKLETLNAAEQSQDTATVTTAATAQVPLPTRRPSR